MQPTLPFIERLARQAGEILRAGYGSEHHIQHKGAIDLVTEMDRRSEAFLLEEIRSSFPQHRIQAEETGDQPGEDCCIWYIDPLDGTVNYAHGIPIFAVSIGFQKDGELWLGVIYDPMREECFSAEHGRGAWLNGKPIQTSRQSSLDQSLLVTGFPYDIRTNPQNNLEFYARFALSSLGVRRLGSAALDLAYVACGRFDGYWETSLQAWDLAAGALIAREAGAQVTDMTGSPNYLTPPHSILAANPALHQCMLQMLSGGRSSGS
jgi:myo-inositol-1(or 4)-monophosphatase